MKHRLGEVIFVCYYVFMDQNTLTPAEARQSFKFLQQDEQSLAFLDNASTTQKPESVLEAMNTMYRYENANVHRGAYRLSELATSRYEAVRGTVKRFINARSPDEIVFTRGCTEAINLVAATLGQSFEAGDEIIITALEHHANLIPWQMLAKQKKLILHVVGLGPDQSLDLQHYKTLLSAKTKLVAVSHISNVLGIINDVRLITEQAHAVGAKVLVDAAQSMAHEPIDVQAIDCDFLTFSAHKHYGPTGIGVLYGKYDVLAQMPPYQTGGSMNVTVSFTDSTFMEPPYRFEAGTPAFVEAVGMGASLDFISAIGFDQIKAYEGKLDEYLFTELMASPFIDLYGTNPNRIGVCSFNVKGVHPHDVATILDQHHVAVRAGHHCAMPLMHYLGVPALVRASTAIYNTKEDIDRLLDALKTVRKIFSDE